MNKFDTNPYRERIVYDENKISEMFSLVETMDTNELLIFSSKNRIPLNLLNKKEETLIHIVVKMDDNMITEKSKLNMCRFLIAHNVSTDQPNKDNISPLHIACQLQLETIIKLLLEYNSDINRQDNIGNTPMHYLLTGIIKNYEIKEIVDIIPPKKRNNDLDKIYSKIKETMHTFITDNLNKLPILETLKKTFENIVDYDKNIEVTLNDIVTKQKEILTNTKSSNDINLIYKIALNKMQTDISNLVQIKPLDDIKLITNSDPNDLTIKDKPSIGIIKNGANIKKEIKSDIEKNIELIKNLEIINNNVDSISTYDNMEKLMNPSGLQILTNNYEEFNSIYMEYKHENAFDNASPLINFKDLVFMGGARNLEIKHTINILYDEFNGNGYRILLIALGIDQSYLTHDRTFTCNSEIIKTFDTYNRRNNIVTNYNILNTSDLDTYFNMTNIELKELLEAIYNVRDVDNIDKILSSDLFYKNTLSKYNINLFSYFEKDIYKMYVLFNNNGTDIILYTKLEEVIITEFMNTFIYIVFNFIENTNTDFIKKKDSLLEFYKEHHKLYKPNLIQVLNLIKYIYLNLSEYYKSTNINDPDEDNYLYTKSTDDRGEKLNRLLLGFNKIIFNNCNEYQLANIIVENLTNIFNQLQDDNGYLYEPFINKKSNIMKSLKKIFNIFKSDLKYFGNYVPDDEDNFNFFNLFMKSYMFLFRLNYETLMVNILNMYNAAKQPEWLLTAYSIVNCLNSHNNLEGSINDTTLVLIGALGTFDSYTFDNRFNTIITRYKTIYDKIKATFTPVQKITEIINEDANDHKRDFNGDKYYKSLFMNFIYHFNNHLVDNIGNNIYSIETPKEYPSSSETIYKIECDKIWDVNQYDHINSLKASNTFIKNVSSDSNLLKYIEDSSFDYLNDIDIDENKHKQRINYFISLLETLKQPQNIKTNLNKNHSYNIIYDNIKNEIINIPEKQFTTIDINYILKKIKNIIITVDNKNATDAVYANAQEAANTAVAAARDAAVAHVNATAISDAIHLVFNAVDSAGHGNVVQAAHGAARDAAHDAHVARNAARVARNDVRVAAVAAVAAAGVAALGAAHVATRNADRITACATAVEAVVAAAAAAVDEVAAVTSVTTAHENAIANMNNAMHIAHLTLANAIDAVAAAAVAAAVASYAKNQNFNYAAVAADAAGAAGVIIALGDINNVAIQANNAIAIAISVEKSKILDYTRNVITNNNENLNNIINILRRNCDIAIQNSEEHNICYNTNTYITPLLINQDNRAQVSVANHIARATINVSYVLACNTMFLSYDKNYINFSKFVYDAVVVANIGGNFNIEVNNVNNTCDRVGIALHDALNHKVDVVTAIKNAADGADAGDANVQMVNDINKNIRDSVHTFAIHTANIVRGVRNINNAIPNLINVVNISIIAATDAVKAILTNPGTRSSDIKRNIETLKNNIRSAIININNTRKTFTILCNILNDIYNAATVVGDSALDNIRDDEINRMRITTAANTAVDAVANVADDVDPITRANVANVAAYATARVTSINIRLNSANAAIYFLQQSITNIDIETNVLKELNDIIDCLTEIINEEFVEINLNNLNVTVVNINNYVIKLKNNVTNKNIYHDYTVRAVRGAGGDGSTVTNIIHDLNINKQVENACIKSDNAASNTDIIINIAANKVNAINNRDNTINNRDKILYIREVISAIYTTKNTIINANTAATVAYRFANDAINAASAAAVAADTASDAADAIVDVADAGTRITLDNINIRISAHDAVVIALNNVFAKDAVENINRVNESLQYLPDDRTRFYAYVPALRAAVSVLRNAVADGYIGASATAAGIAAATAAIAATNAAERLTRMRDYCVNKGIFKKTKTIYKELNKLGNFAIKAAQVATFYSECAKTLTLVDNSPVIDDDADIIINATATAITEINVIVTTLLRKIDNANNAIQALIDPVAVAAAVAATERRRESREADTLRDNITSAIIAVNDVVIDVTGTSAMSVNNSYKNILQLIKQLNTDNDNIELNIFYGNLLKLITFKLDSSDSNIVNSYNTLLTNNILNINHEKFMSNKIKNNYKMALYLGLHYQGTLHYQTIKDETMPASNYLYGSVLQHPFNFRSIQQNRHIVDKVYFYNTYKDKYIMPTNENFNYTLNKLNYYVNEYTKLKLNEIRKIISGILRNTQDLGQIFIKYYPEILYNCKIVETNNFYMKEYDNIFDYQQLAEYLNLINANYFIYYYIFDNNNITKLSRFNYYQLPIYEKTKPVEFQITYYNQHNMKEPYDMIINEDEETIPPEKNSYIKLSETLQQIQQTEQTGVQLKNVVYIYGLYNSIFDNYLNKGYTNYKIQENKTVYLHLKSNKLPQSLYNHIGLFYKYSMKQLFKELLKCIENTPTDNYVKNCVDMQSLVKEIKDNLDYQIPDIHKNPIAYGILFKVIESYFIDICNSYINIASIKKIRKAFGDDILDDTFKEIHNFDLTVFKAPDIKKTMLNEIMKTNDDIKEKQKTDILADNLILDCNFSNSTILKKKYSIYINKNAIDTILDGNINLSNGNINLSIENINGNSCLYSLLEYYTNYEILEKVFDNYDFNQMENNKPLYYIEKELNNLKYKLYGDKTYETITMDEIYNNIHGELYENIVKYILSNELTGNNILKNIEEGFNYLTSRVLKYINYYGKLGANILLDSNYYNYFDDINKEYKFIDNNMINYFDNNMINYFNNPFYIYENEILKYIYELLIEIIEIIFCDNIINTIINTIKSQYNFDNILLEYIMNEQFKKIIYAIPKYLIRTHLKIYDSRYDKDTSIDTSIKDILNNIFDQLYAHENLISKELIDNMKLYYVNYYETLIMKILPLLLVNCENILKFFITSNRLLKIEQLIKDKIEDTKTKIERRRAKDEIYYMMHSRK